MLELSSHGFSPHSIKIALDAIIEGKHIAPMKTHRMAWGRLALLLAALLLLDGCAKVPVTGRRQLNIVSSGDEMQLGLSSFDQMKTNTPISRDPTANAMVQRVGKRIAAIAGKDLPNAQWEFVVFDSKEANAFCLPGGKVGVYSGILPITKDDAGLATVLGHEIGHAVAHHGAERMSEATVLQKTGQYLGAAVSTNQSTQDVFLMAYGGLAKFGRELPHSRAQESEADHIGIIYMAKAGYDPAQSVAFWQRFSDFNKQQGNEKTSWYAKFLSTHPLNEQRIADLKALLPEAQAEFAKSKPQ
jgi:predicted Zn-dependent protease